MKIFRSFVRVWRLLVERSSWVFILLAGIAIVLIMVSITCEVIMRYFFTRPTIWALEVSTYLLVGPVFLAAAYTLLVDGHVNVTIIRSRLPKRVQAITNITTSVMSLAFVVVLTWNIFMLFLQAYQEQWYSCGFLAAPLSPSYLAMALGCALLCLAILLKIGDYIASLRVKGE